MPLAGNKTETHAQGLKWLKYFVYGSQYLWRDLGKAPDLFPDAEAIYQTLSKKRTEGRSRFEELQQRVRFFNAENPEHVERCSAKLEHASATKIYVIAADRVPNPVFWRFFAAAQLPCIFEGEGTAAPLCNLGKPFLHLYSLEWAAKNPGCLDLLYPDPQLQQIIEDKHRSNSELNKLREFCSQVVWSLTPERGYRETSTGGLCVEESVLGFLREVTTSGTNLNQNFRAVRHTFHNQAQDKVLHGLLRWLEWATKSGKL
jgi:hypothetical protein